MAGSIAQTGASPIISSFTAAAASPAPVDEELVSALLALQYEGKPIFAAADATAVATALGKDGGTFADLMDPDMIEDDDLVDYVPLKMQHNKIPKLRSPPPPAPPLEAATMLR